MKCTKCGIEFEGLCPSCSKDEDNEVAYLRFWAYLASLPIALVLNRLSGGGGGFLSALLQTISFGIVTMFFFIFANSFFESKKKLCTRTRIIYYLIGAVIVAFLTMDSDSSYDRGYHAAYNEISESQYGSIEENYNSLLSELEGLSADMESAEEADAFASELQTIIMQYTYD